MKISNIIKSGLKDNSELPFDSDAIREHIVEILICTKEQRKLPAAKAIVKDKYRSNQSKLIIKEELLSADLEHSTELLHEVYKLVCSAETIADLRKYLKVYSKALQLEKSLQYETELCNEHGDELLKLENTISECLEYKRQINEIYNVYPQDDEYLDIAMRTKEMKQMGLKDFEIIKVLGITRKKYEYTNNKIKLE